MIYTSLVNKENPIKDSFLKKWNLKPYENFLVEEEALSNFIKLKEDLEKENIKIGIDSAFRDIEEQKNVYEEIKEEKGLEYAKAYVAKSGYSEHHTGLAIDIKLESPEECCNTIHKKLKDYGFILRYPKGKEKITGYPYEEWHVRYVGLFPAKIMTEKNLTLEEYLSSYGCILVINKEKGCTSFDVVNEISHLFGIKKVGHTGTLDPMATGVLLVAVGKATKIIELLTAEDKEYIAGVKLGIKTDTYDITGEVLKEKEVGENLPIEEVLQSFQKTYLQEVPIYSAVKVKGKKLYEYARKKEEVDLPKKEVTIKKIKLLEKKKDSFTFQALVTKGCYIRSLINDIGEELNTYATMASLERIKQG